MGSILENAKYRSDLLSLKCPLALQMVTSIRTRFPNLFSHSELETLWYLPQIVRISQAETAAVQEIGQRLRHLNESKRESFIAQNLADLLCRSLGDGKKLYLRIGSTHFAGIKRSLEAASSRHLRVRSFFNELSQNKNPR